MSIQFKSKDLEKFYQSGKSKNIPPDIQKRVLFKLKVLENTVKVDDLKIPPSNNLEKLLGNLKDFYSIRVNNQFRIILNKIIYLIEALKIIL